MGDKYFGFIFSSYAITFAVIAIMIIWALVVHRSRQTEIQRLKDRGVRRRSDNPGRENTHEQQ